MEMTALDYDPFDGDFGRPGDRLLSDKLVTAKKEHSCFHCEGPIQPGTRYRSRAEIVEGSFTVFKWCEPCCEAMVTELTNYSSMAFENRRLMFESQ